MSWNNGYERKRFEKKLKKQREILLMQYALFFCPLFNAYYV